MYIVINVKICPLLLSGANFSIWFVFLFAGGSLGVSAEMLMQMSDASIPVVEADSSSISSDDHVVPSTDGDRQPFCNVHPNIEAQLSKSHMEEVLSAFSQIDLLNPPSSDKLNIATNLDFTGKFSHLLKVERTR